MSKVPEMFGSMVFNDKKMQERLPKSTYRALKKTIQDGEPLDISVANVVAAAMKDWAIEMGATHYTHRSRAAVSARPLRREATQHGIPPRPRLSATALFIFPPRSVLTQARFSIKRLLFSARWSA